MAEDNAPAQSALATVFDHLGADLRVVAGRESGGETTKGVLATPSAGVRSSRAVNPADSTATTAPPTAARPVHRATASRSSSPSGSACQIRGEETGPLGDDDDFVAGC